MKTRPNSWRANLTLILLSTLASIGLAESAIWTYEYAVTARARAVAENTVPNAEAIDLAALGYNYSMVTRKKQPGTFRILSFGDSFAYGIVSYPFTYHGVAAGKLSSDLDTTVEIVNLGEPSISFPQYMAAYHHWSQRLEHDAALFHVYLGNDFSDVAYGHVPRNLPMGTKLPSMRLAHQHSIPRKYKLRVLDYGVAAWLRVSGRVSEADTDDSVYLPVVGRLDDEAYLANARSAMAFTEPERSGHFPVSYRAFAALVQLARDIRRKGRKVAIMISPHEVFVDKALRRRLEQHGTYPQGELLPGFPAYVVTETVRRIDPLIPVVDVHSALLCAAQHGLDTYFGQDTHWSQDGNTVVGNTLAEALATAWFERSAARVSTDSCENVSAAATARVANLYESEVWPAVSGALEQQSITTVDLGHLSRSNRPPRFAITSLNGDSYSSLKTEPGAPARARWSADGFDLNGWALSYDGLPDAVYVSIDKRYFEAIAGHPRSDVAASFGDRSLMDSGYILRLPGMSVQPGLHQIRVHTLNHDGSLSSSPAVPIFLSDDGSP